MQNGAVSGESIYYGYLLFIVALNALCIFILNLRFKKTDIFEDIMGRNKNYCKSIKSRPILNNVSYNFEYGKIYGIYGHNGSGKTMLLRAIAGCLFPTAALL